MKVGSARHYHMNVTEARLTHRSITPRTTGTRYRVWIGMSKPTASTLQVRTAQVSNILRRLSLKHGFNIRAQPGPLIVKPKNRKTSRRSFTAALAGVPDTANDERRGINDTISLRQMSAHNVGDLPLNLTLSCHPQPAELHP